MNRIKLIYFFYIFIIAAFNCFSQEKSVLLTTKELPNAKFIRNETFDGKGLWGYINGGADLYLEYGFEKVFVQQFELDSIEFKADFFRMKNSESAFGIYSIFSFNCETVKENPQLHCISPSQLLIAFGKYYIQITNDKKNDKSRQLNLELYNTILKYFLPEKLVFPSELIAEIKNKDDAKIRFITGKLGIQNGFSDWENLFENIMNFNLWIIFDKVSGNCNFIKLNFLNSEELKKFTDNFTQSNEKSNYKLITEKLTLIIRK